MGVIASVIYVHLIDYYAKEIFHNFRVSLLFLLRIVNCVGLSVLFGCLALRFIVNI